MVDESIAFVEDADKDVVPSDKVAPIGKFSISEKTSSVDASFTSSIPLNMMIDPNVSCR